MTDSIKVKLIDGRHAVRDLDRFVRNLYLPIPVKACYLVRWIAGVRDPGNHRIRIRFENNFSMVGQEYVLKDGDWISIFNKGQDKPTA